MSLETATFALMVEFFILNTHIQMATFHFPQNIGSGYFSRTTNETAQI